LTKDYRDVISASTATRSLVLLRGIMRRSVNMKAKRLAIDGMLCAMCAVLGYIAIDATAFKVTFETVPILLAALMFGPVDGLAVGGIGTLIYQLLKYGVSATTVLWILPYVLMGLLLGLYSKKYNYKNTNKQILVAVILAELLVTVLNTGVMYIDAVMYSYYFKGFITGSLALRLVICIAKAIVFGIVIPKITTAVKKAI